MPGKIIEPIIQEQWVLDGIASPERHCQDDQLYIKPLLQQRGIVPDSVQVIHSLILDNNVFSDLLENRRPENIDYLTNLVRNTSIELNPTMAILEQRQKFFGATSALQNYAQLLESRFGWSLAKIGVKQFESDLAAGKAALVANIDLLSGYIAAIIFLYHQKHPAAEKLKWLSGIIKNTDLPFFQLQFYFAALIFLAAEQPSLRRFSR